MRRPAACAGKLGRLTALCVSLIAFAQASAAPDDTPPKTILAADRVLYWDSEGTRWVWLQGNASVESEVVAGKVAGDAVVRVRARRVGDTTVGQLEIYNVRPDQSLSFKESDAASAFETNRAVVLKAHTADGVTKQEKPPAGFAFTLSVQETTKTAPTIETSNTSDAPTSPLKNGAIVEPDGVASQVEQSKRDDEVVRVQDLGPGTPEFAPLTGPDQNPDSPPDQDPLDEPQVPAGGVQEPTITDVEPLPVVPSRPVDPEALVEGAVLPSSRRVWWIEPRQGGRPWQIETVNAADGSTAFVIRGGVDIVSEMTGIGRVDLAADNVVIWMRPREDGRQSQMPNPGAGRVEQDADTPLEVYLEGDVIIRHDRLKVAGPSDQTTFKARQAYYDFRTDRVLALDGEFDVFAPGLITPMRTKGEVMRHYHDTFVGPDGKLQFGSARVSVDRTTSTGSRFPKPGYRFNSRSVDLTEVPGPLTDPATGAQVGPLHARDDLSEITWLIDARQNVYLIGGVPFFYWPRFRAESDDLDPPLRNLGFRYGSYFGYQVLTDWNGFKLLGMQRPKNIDNWNVDVDWLSFRGPAVGSEIGWFGRDLIGDFLDPYHTRNLDRDVDHPYFGYSDAWGIIDHHNDVLGSGPAIVTYGPPGAGKKGYQRINVPTFQNERGRYLTRHMQELLGPDADVDDELRVQFEMAAYSDRHFLEQYYKRLFDSGLDQDTLAYLIYQRRNRALTIDAQVNFMDWITDTQWLPKLEYYRIGDSFLNHLFSYSSNYGVDYANVHTAVEVNNPNIFAFIPYDPISNTSRPWESGRAWTTQEVDLPIKLGGFNIVPYVQGQVMGWSNQLDYQTQGRAWGAYGARFNVMATRIYADAENELLNIHGLAHKATLNVDYRSAYSTLSLNRVGVQDMLDDDTYELTRRYFALTNYVGGVLPYQYDPRYLILRRTLNPVAFAPDIQDSIETFTVSLNQRLQTKRGPDGRRRIVDWMILDAQTTFFPNSQRDNFGEPMGQTMYNYEWYLGDRTSLISTGWFEFWNVVGNPILVTDPRKSNDPFGLRVINAGVSINRPPRGNVYFGYSIINTGPIATSALNASFNYWLSPKWYASFATSYDFGNAILLGSTASVTKIGADFLTSIGLSVDPQRQNYTFGLEIAPRFSPSTRLGSAVGSRFDSRFAPTQ